MAKQEVDININITIDAQSPHSRFMAPISEELPEKIKVNLSVAQLAYIFKVLSDMKTIEPESVSDLIRFVTKNTSTPKAESISFDSFKARFYNPSHTTKQFFHDFIVKQLNYIRKELKA
ncbi:MAG TPA: hypothetical protein ACFCUD_00560 [Cyclobacteriaceae bacterium]